MLSKKYNSFRDISIRFARKLYRIISNRDFLNPECLTDRENSNILIFDLLNENRPCMISRFGTTELNAINNYLVFSSKKSFLKKIIDFIIDNTHTPWWDKSHFNTMSIYSGIFPPTQETAENFSIRYLDDIPLIDLLGSFQYYEKFMPLREDLIKVQLEMLYPFFVSKPWTRVLKGKNVLVIHPFEDSIREQYQKRKLLFDNEDILPDFNLITYKAIQSVAGNSVPFENWFSALAKMENDIALIDFDFALIGCGAYGLPLAAHVKRMGKKAIHLGGGLQLMFGILGKRWLEQYNDTWHYRPGVKINIDYKPLFNKHWIYPLTSDTPFNNSLVENGCYWK